VNAAETVITPATVGMLTRLCQQKLPAVVDSSPVELAGIMTASGMKTLLYATTTGSLLAFDATTGQLVWQATTTGPKITTSSPAIDPIGQYVYGYGLDGKIHKYASGTGQQITTGGWPVPVTLMTMVEKGSSALNIGNGYLYATESGYTGDGGHYIGHVVAINLQSGKATVFNALCSNPTMLLQASAYPAAQAGIWARAGAVIDPAPPHNIFVSTGNGAFDASTGATTTAIASWNSHPMRPGSSTPIPRLPRQRSRQGTKTEASPRPRCSRHKKGVPLPSCWSRKAWT